MPCENENINQNQYCNKFNKDFKKKKRSGGVLFRANKAVFFTWSGYCEIDKGPMCCRMSTSARASLMRLSAYIALPSVESKCSNSSFHLMSVKVFVEEVVLLCLREK